MDGMKRTNWAIGLALLGLTTGCVAPLAGLGDAINPLVQNAPQLAQLAEQASNGTLNQYGGGYPAMVSVPLGYGQQPAAYEPGYGYGGHGPMFWDARQGRWVDGHFYGERPQWDADDPRWPAWRQQQQDVRDINRYRIQAKPVTGKPSTTTATASQPLRINPTQQNLTTAAPHQQWVGNPNGYGGAYVKTPTLNPNVTIGAPTQVTGNNVGIVPAKVSPFNTRGTNPWNTAGTVLSRTNAAAGVALPATATTFKPWGRTATTARPWGKH
jgi:hypothetical protein